MSQNPAQSRFELDVGAYRVAGSSLTRQVTVIRRIAGGALETVFAGSALDADHIGFAMRHAGAVPSQFARLRSDVEYAALGLALRAIAVCATYAAGADHQMGLL